jgi:tripartite-type tricarboxylate transporter receptor subunit TctC
VQAQDYPSKPVRLIIPWAAGGSTDSIGRILAQKLNEYTGQQWIVDNRAGATGTIGHALAAKAPPDGYTILLGTNSTFAIAPHLYKALQYDNDKSFTPISLVAISPQILSVHPSLPVKSVPDLVRFAKTRPGKLNYASAGIGNLQHLGMESLQTMAGIRMNHVPYKGAAPAFNDLISGQVELMFANIIGVLPHVKSARVRAIAVSTAKRATVLPDIPSVAEIYPDFDVNGWMGIFVPATTPREITAKLHEDIVKVLMRQDTRERLASQGAEVVAGTPEQLSAFVRRESALYAKIIQSSGIKTD